MKFTYLLINFFTILIPIARSFEPRLHFYTKWKYYLPGMFLTAAFFIVWDYFKTRYGVWSFNDQYIMGIRFFGLPIEELLFFITVPYACTFIYETVTYFVKPRIFPDSSIYVLWLMGLGALAASPFEIHRVYTFSVLLTFGIAVRILTPFIHGEKLDKFIQTYLISLLPMLVVNGLLTGLPVVIYNNRENLNIRLGTIPVEDFVYCAILLLMNIALYEWARLRAAKN